MYYTVYKITNKIDSKIYIGKHQTNNLDDNYMGSGKLLSRAKQKHGKENFSKEILFVFDNEEDMNAKEAELVNEEFCNRNDTYNLCPGGNGGWGYVNSTNHNNVSNKRQTGNFGFKLKRVKASSKVLSEAQKQRYKNGGTNGFAGKTHTEETKKMISKSASNKTGNKNSQFGSCWITDGNINKKIKKTEPVPLGWRKGRVMVGSSNGKAGA